MTSNKTNPTDQPKPTTRIRPEIKAMWLEALRSGRYKQTTQELRTTVPRSGEYGYCCLGVLCDVRRKVAREPWERFVNQGTQGDSETLPRDIAEWAGLRGFDQRDPRVSNGHRNQSLSKWNDDEGLSFEQIADLIEKEL
jgi:hypothetical protein